MNKIYLINVLAIIIVSLGLGGSIVHGQLVWGLIFAIQILANTILLEINVRENKQEVEDE